MNSNVFRRDGICWAVWFAGQRLQLEARKGPEYIALLLACPGEPVHVCRLAALARGKPPSAVLMPDPHRAEQTRKAVTNRIRATIATIESRHTELGEHLRRSIRTGTYCSYAPGRTFHWEL